MNARRQTAVNVLDYQVKRVSVVKYSPLNMEQRNRLKQILAEKSVGRGDFTLASGKKSSFYVDAKMTTLDPEGITYVADLVWQHLQSLPTFPKAIGGLATGADPIVAEVVALSFRRGGPSVYGFYVREEAKGHGTRKSVEGYAGVHGDPVVIVDDVCTTGGSAIKAIERAKENGWKVVATICLVDREEGGREAIERYCPFDALFTADELLTARDELLQKVHS